MRNFYTFLWCVAFFKPSSVLGSEAGMPQLNPEFWTAQIFWLILIFSGIYVIIWKVFLPKISISIENRKMRVLNDLNETQKLKENAEKKLKEYNKLIDDSKKEANKIIEDNRKKLENNIEKKKQEFNQEIDKELTNVEIEIKKLKKNSISSINKIAVDVTCEVLNQMFESKVNTSNVSARVEEISKKKIEKYL